MNETPLMVAGDPACSRVRKVTTCDTCHASANWLTEMECPLLASDTMGESDGTVCWLCKGSGNIHVCANCFYLGPDEAARMPASGATRRTGA